MRHTPLLSKTLLDAAKGRLKEGDFPHVEKPAKGGESASRLIVFIVGGITYEEAKTAAYFNEAHGGSASPPPPAPRTRLIVPRADQLRAIVGGTCIHNTESFLAEISAACAT